MGEGQLLEKVLALAQGQGPRRAQGWDISRSALGLSRRRCSPSALLPRSYPRECGCLWPRGLAGSLGCPGGHSPSLRLGQLGAGTRRRPSTGLSVTTRSPHPLVWSLCVRTLLLGEDKPSEATLQGWRPEPSLRGPAQGQAHGRPQQQADRQTAARHPPAPFAFPPLCHLSPALRSTQSPRRACTRWQGPGSGLGRPSRPLPPGPRRGATPRTPGSHTAGAAVRDSPRSGTFNTVAAEPGPEAPGAEAREAGGGQRLAARALPRRAPAPTRTGGAPGGGGGCGREAGAGRGRAGGGGGTERGGRAGGRPSAASEASAAGGPSGGRARAPGPAARRPAEQRPPRPPARPRPAGARGCGAAGGGGRGPARPALAPDAAPGESPRSRRPPRRRARISPRGPAALFPAGGAGAGERAARSRSGGAGAGSGRARPGRGARGPGRRRGCGRRPRPPP